MNECMFESNSIRDVKCMTLGDSNLKKLNQCNAQDNHNHTKTDNQHQHQHHNKSYKNIKDNKSSESSDYSNNLTTNDHSDNNHSVNSNPEQNSNQKRETMLIRETMFEYKMRVHNNKPISNLEVKEMLKQCLTDGKYNFQLKQEILSTSPHKHQFKQIMQSQIVEDVLVQCCNKNAFSLVIQFLQMAEYSHSLIDKILLVYPQMLSNENALVVLIHMLQSSNIHVLNSMIIQLLSN